MPAVRPVRPSIRSIRGVAGLGALLVALLAWAVASPVGASPDEDYHLASIWCAQGERDGLCAPGDGPERREVQRRLLTAQGCYNFQPEESAACQAERMADSTTTLESDRGNFNGSYPPVFYFVQGLLASERVIDAVLLMRAANALFAVLLLAAVGLAAPPGLRRGLVGGAAVTVVPLGMFVLPSVNPSSWAVLSAMTLPVAVLGYITTDEPGRRRVLGALAALALGIGAGARADAALFGVLAIGLAGVMTLRPGWPYVRRLVYPAVLAVVGLWLYLTTGQAESIGTAARPEASVSGVVDLLGDIPSLWTGALGGWPLGWVDTPMPAVVGVASWSILVGCVFAALAGAHRRQLLALGIGGVAVWLVPTYMQHLTGLAVGAAIQPRYVLPIIAIVAVVAMSRTGGSVVRWSGGQWLLVVVALTVANAQALHTNLRRYVTGTDVISLNLDAGAEWWWEGLPVGPNVVWALGSVAFALALLLLTWTMRGPELPVDAAAGAARARDEQDRTDEVGTTARGADDVVVPAGRGAS